MLMEKFLENTLLFLAVENDKSKWKRYDEYENKLWILETVFIKSNIRESVISKIM